MDSFAVMSGQKEIYFHIGLGKTGTTFLQYRAFPYFSGFEYIQRTRFDRAKEIIEQSHSDRFFISYECDQQLWDVAEKWAKDFPNTIPIIVFRRHDSWIASQFRRFVKNCHVRTFDELFVIGEDSGLFKQKDLTFYPMISYLEQVFGQRAIVLLYDEMRKDPRSFIESLAHKMSSDIDLSKVDFSKKHTSYSEKQLKGLMATQRYVNLKKKVVFKNKVIEFFRKTLVNGTRYLILFVSKLLPERFFTSDPLVDPKDLAKVREHFESDWTQVVERADKLLESK